MDVAHWSAVLADQPVSLMRGWLPIAVQALAAAILVYAICGRTRRWLLQWSPVALLSGVTVAVSAHWYVLAAGLSDTPSPLSLWIWIGVTGVALTVLLLGWRGAHLWRRGAALLAVPLCVISLGLSLNSWVGYTPTIQTAWYELTSGPLPDQSDLATITKLGPNGSLPPRCNVVSVTIPDTASGFKHRDELVYLPPAWTAAKPPPQLPAVMMIGAVLQDPADWIRIGNAVTTADDFAARHGGNAPVLVFVDATGEFDNDTECVNGPRGNSADHLVKDVVPFINSQFGTSPRAANWGVAGFSSGGTCAIDLTVMHPDVFSTFVDIAGDLAPNSGSKAETIDRLFGGNADAYDAFDPTTVISRHGRYVGVSGWFPAPSGDTDNGNVLCGLARSNGIDCSVTALPGQHDWPFAATAFANALPWLAGQLGTPGAPRVPMPAAS
jgi:S-formylglutathione hydrolase FrmB